MTAMAEGRLKETCATQALLLDAPGLVNQIRTTVSAAVVRPTMRWITRVRYENHITPSATAPAQPIVRLTFGRQRPLVRPRA